MNKFSKVSVLVLSLSLILAFFFPVWKIDLEAPQYPEGLGMKIWINKLSGDINTINGLNHYIGMQYIEEDSIPELKYMPYLLGFLILLGIITSFAKRKGLLYTWVVLFAILGVAGAVDFYLWEYDYGHNLDPRAAIKIEGMSYQPPLLGSKELLNFVAHSYPDIGGFVILTAAFLAMALMAYNILEKKTISLPSITAPVQKPMINSMNSILLAGFFLSVASCEIKPQPINYGTDHCDHCKMGISHERFGAEMVTDKGKVFKFDATECMINFMKEKYEQKSDEIKLVLVADASNGGNLIDAYSALYLKSESFPSPMGSNISAYGSGAELARYQKEYPGQKLNWQEVENIILSK